MHILNTYKCKLTRKLSWSAHLQQRWRMRPVVSLTCQTPQEHNNTCKLDWFLNPFDAPKAQSDSRSITASCREMTKYPSWSSRLILYDIWMTRSRTSKDGHATHYERSACIVGYLRLFFENIIRISLSERHLYNPQVLSMYW